MSRNVLSSCEYDGSLQFTLHPLVKGQVVHYNCLFCSCVDSLRVVKGIKRAVLLESTSFIPL